jgi:hypothetical protein
VRTRTRECECGDGDYDGDDNENENGENKYKRTISGDGSRRNRKCKGHSKEEIPCNEFPCCNWGEFCEWSECDAPCGGVRRRYAKCDCTPQEPVYLKRDDDHGHMSADGVIIHDIAATDNSADGVIIADDDDDHVHSGDGVILDYSSKEYVECLGDQPYEEEVCEPCYPSPEY